jgi:O-antigen ligase
VILAFAAGHVLARVGTLADALLAAAVLCTVWRARRAAIAGTLVATPILLGAELWRSTQIEHLRHHPALAAAAIAGAVIVVGALAALLHGRPRLLALLAVLTIPFRFSFLAGGTGGILLPLYAVIWAGGLAYVLERAPHDEPPAGSRAGALERSIAAFVVLYAVSALYTPTASLAKAVEDVGFFLAPFSVLFVLLRGLRWDRALCARCLGLAFALAGLFVAVAAAEYASRHLIFNAGLDANQRFFRVNSLFYDPNIFGRFLAIAMVLVAAALLWEESRRRVLVVAALLAVLWLGLLATASQSSIVALLGGLAVAGGLRFSWRRSVAVAAVLVAAGVVVAVAASGRLHITSANEATSGRASLVQQGGDMFAARPIQGYGAGAFSCEYLRRSGESCAHPPAGLTSDSHTIPVTVAAEQGVIGLIAYLWLLAAAVWRLASGGVRRSVARVAVLAAFAALVVHTWAYADFLEDPITWTLLAAGSGLAAG